MENKTYLYHGVPENMKMEEGGKELLYPLNMLKDKFPELYKIELGKYESKDERRKNIPNRIIPTLKDAAWGDVIQLTSVHPEELSKALREAGLQPQEMKFYQIDPELLDPEKTTIYLYRDDKGTEDPENFSPYDPKNLEEHSQISDSTKEYYKKSASENERPLLFVGVPHIFHKGPLDVSNFPVITVNAKIK